MTRITRCRPHLRAVEVRGLRLIVGNDAELSRRSGTDRRSATSSDAEVVDLARARRRYSRRTLGPHFDRPPEGTAA